MKKSFKKTIMLFVCLTVCLFALNLLGSDGLDALFLQTRAATSSELLAGDINDDGKVNNKDLVRLKKYISGKDVDVVEALLDTNGDKSVNDRDVTHLMKFIAGQDVVLYPVDEYQIIYNIVDNDSYLQKLYDEGKIKNSNPTTYSSEEGVSKLYNLSVAGYNFGGWYTLPDGEGDLVKKIPAGEKGTVELYAKWSLKEYEIQFDSPDVPCSSVTYTVNKGRTLSDPEKQFGYTFVGWSNDDGFIVNRIKPGTTGNIVLHANWTSDRKKAVSYSDYGEPIMIEDGENGQFLFVYDIGRIENVPLYSVDQEMGKTKTEGIEINKTFEVSTYIDEEELRGVVNSVSAATTRSSGWTLSKEWNNIYESGEEYADKQVKSVERTDSEGNVVGGKYFISNSQGGSSYVSTESGGSKNTSAKVTTENSFGINSSYDESTEKYCDAKLGVENKLETGVEASVPIDIVKVGASVKNTTTIGAEVSNGRKDNTAFHVDSSVSGYVGTVDITDVSTHYNNVVSNQSNWNSTQSYEQSYESSRETSITNAIANEISKTTTYNIKEALGGGESETYTLDEASKKSDEYSHTAKYAQGSTDKTSTDIKIKANAYGYYRMVMATTVHVYGVVGYDVATNSYYTYTYDVVSDDRYLYLDYSKDTVNFDDCENGLVTFEIPYEVNEYIMGITGKTDGLVFGSKNTVTEFNKKSDFDGIVVVPQYQSTDNGDGTFSPVRVTKISADAFKNNTDIEAVILPLYVTEIPAGAFEGCTNLKTVIAYGVTKIGANAFKGCTSLEKFAVDNHITYLGKNAFAGVNEISVMAAKASVADAAIASGAKKLTLNLSKITDNYNNKVVEISKDFTYFALIGNGSDYKNLRVISNAGETYISNIKFKNNKDVPITISSKNVTLGRVAVYNAPGFAMVLKGSGVKLKLYDNNILQSESKNAVISKGVTLSKSNSSYEGKITTKGNYLVFGSVSNKALLTINNGDSTDPVVITESQYNSYLSSFAVTFNANEGSLADGSKTKIVYNSQTYGTLPVPTRENYAFDGWYTKLEGGTKVTATTVVTASGAHTLYARWTRNAYNVTFNANGGSVAVASKTVKAGETYGDLPVPTRDYYNFTGWQFENGTKVTSTTVVELTGNTVLYATWTLKPVSGWVLETSMPAGAQVVSQKWSYTQRNYKETVYTSESGWTRYDAYWVKSSTGSFNYATFPAGFDTGNWYYKNWARSAYGASQSETFKREVSTSWAGYVYWHWMYDTNYANGTSGRAIYNKSGTGPANGYYYKYFGAFTSTTNYTNGGTGYTNNQGITNYIVNDRTSWNDCQGATRWFRFNYYLCSYTDYYRMFKYYQDVNLESSSTPSGSNISNVKKWVQYREK